MLSGDEVDAVLLAGAGGEWERESATQQLMKKNNGWICCCREKSVSVLQHERI